MNTMRIFVVSTVAGIGLTVIRMFEDMEKAVSEEDALEL